MAKYFGLLLVVCLALATYQPAAAHAGHNHHRPRSPYRAIASNHQLSILTTLLKATGLDTVLRDPYFEGTIFAPTDAAFKTFLKKTGLSVATVLANPNSTIPLLKYHATSTVVLSKAIPKAPKNATVTTLINQTLTAYKTKYVIISSFAVNAKVLKADIKTKKAVIHIIDTVLVPEGTSDYPGCKSPAGVLVGLKAKSLVKAVKAAGLLEALDNKTFTGTILAPTDKAFAKLFKALKTSLPKLDKKVLTSVLLYHVLPAPVTSKYVTNGTVIPTLNNQTLTSLVNKYGIYFKGAGSTAKVVKNGQDYVGCRVVVHVIDTVLLPKL